MSRTTELRWVVLALSRLVVFVSGFDRHLTGEPVGISEELKSQIAHFKELTIIERDEVPSRPLQASFAATPGALLSRGQRPVSDQHVRIVTGNGLRRCEARLSWVE